MLFLMICISFSCKNAQNNSVLKAMELVSGKNLAEKKAIIVIADKGCIPCNQNFTNYFTNYLLDSNIEFIVSANSNNIDLSRFLNPKLNNVAFDTQKLLYNKGIIKNSSVYFLSNGQIDTALKLNQNNLIDNQYIKNRLRKDID